MLQCDTVARLNRYSDTVLHRDTATQLHRYSVTVDLAVPWHCYTVIPLHSYNVTAKPCYIVVPLHTYTVSATLVSYTMTPLHSYTITATPYTPCYTLSSLHCYSTLCYSVTSLHIYTVTTIPCYAKPPLMRHRELAIPLQLRRTLP